MKERLDNLYFNNNGIVYIDTIPRVTEILSAMLHEDSLMFWANGLGFKRMNYGATLEQAAHIGTLTHEAAEHILLNKSCEEYTDLYFRQVELNNSIGSFIDWYGEVGDKIEVISMEVPQYDNHFRGTYDLLARINGKIYLVDFKTSSHIGYRYFLQLAAYRYLIKINQGIDIDGTLILQLSKKKRQFREYVLDFSDKKHLRFINNCQEAFFSIVYAYHHRKHIETQFKTIF